MSPPPLEDAFRLADRLARRLASVEGPARPRLALDVLLALPPEVGAGLLEALMDRRKAGDGKADEALAAVGVALSELGEVEAASDLYQAARDLGREDVARLLMRPAPAKAFDPREERSVDHEMRKVALGTRKQMARLADPVIRARLLADPDPGVIANLLRHPRLTEPEVVRIAARRPARPEVLTEVFKNPRWRVRGRVRVALANNPYTPTEIALKLVPLLTLPEVRELAQSRTLHPEVLRSARERLTDAAHRRKVAHDAAHLAELEPEGDA
jgi:hypothetical protein